MDKITKKQIAKKAMPKRATEKEDRPLSKPRMEDSLYWHWWKPDESTTFWSWERNNANLNTNLNEKRCREERVAW